MKKTILFLVMLSVMVSLHAQDKMLVYVAGETIGMLVSETDSLYFTDEGTVACFRVAGVLHQYYITQIDSITFDLAADSTVFIYYSGNAAWVVNPLESQGVIVETAGADVTVHSTADFTDIDYVLSGNTPDGMFKIYSDKRFNLHLDDVQIANPDGPAVNIQSTKKISVILEGGSGNILTDGAIYGPPAINGNGDPEDQDAAFFSEGQLVFSGAGTLVINGYGEEQHGLRSDDFIGVNEGQIIIATAVNDGIHSNDGFYMSGGTVEVTSAGDGIDGSTGTVEITGGNVSVNCSGDNTDAIQSDSTLTIAGGTISITVAGDQAKGLKAAQTIAITGGDLEIHTTGGVTLAPLGQGYDPSYCTAIKGGTLISIESGNITLETDGEAGRGVSCEGDISITGGTLEVESSGDGDTYTNFEGELDAYHGSCINANGSIAITGGEVTLHNTGDGGKGISADGGIIFGGEEFEPLINVTTTGQRITIIPGGPGPNGGGVYDEAKAVTADGPIAIEGGNLEIDAADDGIKSTESVTINDGLIHIVDSEEGIESPNILINGGSISLKSSDDGLNATYGDGGESYDGSVLSLTAGYVFLNSTGGDPLDSNGDIYISGGTLVVHGPQSQPEVGMDVNGGCFISGGFLVVSGTNSFMTEGASPSSTQPSVLLRTNQGIAAGTIFHIEDSNGSSLLTFAPLRSYYSIIFSSPELSTGNTYKVYTGGSSTGTLLNGLYTGGTYSGGNLKATFTLNGMAPTIWF